MTISSTTSKVSYILNGATVSFPVPFYFLSAGDLRVIRATQEGDETVLSLTTDYGVSGAGNAAGGTVTLASPGIAGHSLTILRTLKALQPLDLKPNDAFPAESLETALDRQCMLIQQLTEQTTRSVRLPETETAGIAVVLPPLATRKGKQAWFDAATGGLVGVDAGATLTASDIITVPTVATLRATSPASYSVALTRGNITAFDGGGGLWHWDASSVLADDGVLVVKPSSTSGAGRWRRDTQSNRLSINAFPNVKADDAAFDNAPGFQAALDLVRSKGIAITVPVGSWYFRSRIQLNDDNKLIGASMFNTHLVCAASAFNLVKLNNWGTWQECVLERFTVDGFDDANAASIGVRIGDEAASTVDNNQCVRVSQICFGAGWNIGVLCETEADNSEVCYCRSDQQFGLGWLKHLRSLTNASGDTACMSIHHNHISPTSRAVWGKNQFGIWVEAAESALIQQNIINNFDTGYRIWSGVSSSRPTMTTAISSCHYEDLRDFIADPAARANSTAYAVNSIYRPTTTNGYFYRVTTAGTSASSPPTFPTTIGTSFTDGSMTVLCAGYQSMRWTAGRLVSVGQTCKPNKNNAGKCFTAVWECTTGGTTGGTEPTTWGTEYGDTVNDNGVVWTLRHKSQFVEFNSQSATHSLRVDGCRTLKPLTLVSLKGKGRVIVSNHANFDTTSRGGTDYALFCGTLTGASSVRLEAGMLTGNIKPYTTAVADTYVATVTLDHTSVSNESLGHIRTDGDGLYACFSSLCEPDDGGVRSVSGTTTTINLLKDKLVYLTSASPTVVTMPTPDVSIQGRVVTIYCQSTGGVTVNFPSAVRVKGQDLTSFWMGRSGLYLTVECVGTGYRLIGCSPSQKIEVTNTQATGANGGNLTPATWNTRTLNSKDVDEGNNATLASNKLTLKPGIYELVEAMAIGYNVGRQRIRLWNVTGNTSIGTGPVSTTGAGVQGPATIGRSLVFTLTADTDFYLQHYIESNGTTGEGLALNATASPEIYASLALVKHV